MDPKCTDTTFIQSITYTDDPPSVVEFGSGGGAAYVGALLNGAPGGGRIILNVAGKIYIKDNTSVIQSNGMGCSISGAMACGSGSGGSIYINTGGILYNPISTSLYTLMSVGGFGVGTITVNGFTESNAFYNIFANGGSGGNGGGGGRIKIEKSVSQAVSIKKTLAPMARSGAPLANTCSPLPPSEATNCFNPYALQKGDKIKVILDVSNLVPGKLHLEDEMLKVPYSAIDTAYCTYVDATLDTWKPGDADPFNHTPMKDTPDAALVLYNPDGLGIIPKLSWDRTIPTSNPAETERLFGYDCVVQ